MLHALSKGMCVITMAPQALGEVERIFQSRALTRKLRQFYTVSQKYSQHGPRSQSQSHDLLCQWWARLKPAKRGTVKKQLRSISYRLRHNILHTGLQGRSSPIRRTGLRDEIDR
jgi:hypothetical protein